MKPSRRLILALFGILLSAETRAAIPITCWDVASEFNDSANPDAANPSGVWSYGWKKTLTDKFFLALTQLNNPPACSGWCNASGYPMLYHITRPVPALLSPDYGLYPPHVLGLHPGINGEYAVLRFTAPADGHYKVSGQFSTLDVHGTDTTTDVWVLKNNDRAEAFGGKVSYRGGVQCSSFTSKEFDLKQGGTLDFQVGYGDNKSYFYDSTGLVAIIEKIK